MMEYVEAVLREEEFSLIKEKEHLQIRVAELEKRLMNLSSHMVITEHQYFYPQPSPLLEEKRELFRADYHA